MRVLHVAAEVFPLVKTGGLADVVAALPLAQRQAGCDTRLLLPGYPAILDALNAPQLVCEAGPAFGALRVRLLRGTLGSGELPAYVVHAPYLYGREGGPYQDASGEEWPDNAQRFALLGWIAAHLAAGDADDQWRPDVVHAHDWHAALACTYITGHPGRRARSVFTIHNLAYQGLFPLRDAALLQLPSRWLTSDGLEFHGQLNFMKAGLVHADAVTTVSPSYAREITTPEFGCGLEGVIRMRSSAVTGILNGIDDVQWNPANDPALAAPFEARTLAGKLACRRALQQELGLDVDDSALLMCVVSRLTAQKGLDLVIAGLKALLRAGVQLALQGTGDFALEAAFRMATNTHPGRVQARLEWNEDRSHRLIAGADVIAVTSRFEPCGLTQMYGLRYGTLPIVRRVGGLADTVVDCSPANLVGGTATGFVFDAATPEAFERAVHRALELRQDATAWSATMRRGMRMPLSWAEPARHYLALYEQL
jgi:starch synthase